MLMLCLIDQSIIVPQITIQRSGVLQITGTQQMQNISTCYEDY